MLSNDKRIFDKFSATASRMKALGDITDHLWIIGFGVSGRELQLSEKVTVFPASKNKLVSVPKAFLIAKNLLKKTKINLVTTHDPFLTGLAGYGIKIFLGLKLQLQSHTDILDRNFRQESVLNRLRYWLALWLIPRADCLRVVSDRVRLSVMAKFPNLNIQVLPVFIAAEKIRSSPVTIDLHNKYPNYSRIILMASRLTREKNFSLALEAMVGVVKKHPKTLLLIVGAGPEKNNLENLILKLNLANNVIIEDWTDNLFSYYKTTDIYLLTSDYEGYSRSVIEAMITGCPVIMTDVGIAGSLLKDRQNGIIVPVGDPVKLKTTILELMENDNLRNQISEKAKKIIARMPSPEHYLVEHKKLWTTC